MKRAIHKIVYVAAFGLLLTSCDKNEKDETKAETNTEADAVILEVKNEFVPDKRVALFEVESYKKDGKLLYKAIGEEGESEITNFIGYNPQVSPNGKSFAYWWNENNDLTVVLGVYDSKLNIHRNILRGIILPTWITQDKIAGIKADSCLGESCLLYQFQTASLAIVDILNGEVTPVDQAKSISNITFNRAN